MFVDNRHEAKANVLVTGVGGRSVGLQILLSLKMADTPYRVVATDAEPFSFGLFSVTRRYLVPYANSPDYFGRLTDIVARESIEIILPGTEAEVAVLAPRAGELAAKYGVRLVASYPEPIALCQDKANLTQWLEAKGHEPPRSASGQHWKELAQAVGYPLLVKPRSGTSGSRGVAILADEEEAVDYLEGRRPDSILFQEYVGDDEHEYTVGVMTDSSGTIIDSIIMKRVLVGLSLMESRVIGDKRYALSTGYSQGIVVDDAVIRPYCEGLVRELGLVGPVNIQCRTDCEGQRVRVFEVHPRFSGSSAIRSEVGFNEADTLVRSWLLGERFGRLNYRMNVAAIRAFQTLVVPMDDYNQILENGEVD